MWKKATNKTGKGQNIKVNAAKRLEAAKRKGKSANYIKDLETSLSKKH